MEKTMNNKTTGEDKLSPNEQKNLILNMVADFAESGQMIEYLEHIGFDFSALRETKDFSALILGHYRLKSGCYDVDRAATDLRNWPPIAARILDLMEKKAREEQKLAS